LVVSIICRICKKNKLQIAKGLCNHCYGTKYRKENKDKVKKSRERWINNNREIKNELQRVWAKKNRNKLSIIEKRWRDNNSDKVEKYKKSKRTKTYKEQSRKYRKENRKLMNKSQRRFRENNPNKDKIHHFIDRATRFYGFPKAKEFKCLSCPKQAQGYHHYKGYKEENWLDIEPYCNKCHRREDKKLRMEAKANERRKQ